MLTEEILALLESRIVRANLRGVMVEVQPDILDELISEVRRLRAELERRDAEADAHEDVLETYTSQNIKLLFIVDQLKAENAALRESISRMGDAAFNLRDAVAALDTKPDAAPVENAPRRPMLGDTLKNAITEGKRIVVKETGERGVVFSIFSTEDSRKYRVEHGGEYVDYNRDEIELAPVENAIKVGDTVRVTKNSFYHGRTGKVAAIEGVPALYSVEISTQRKDVNVIADYYLNEIEPA